MSHIRVIPCLLLKNNGLVKTVKFKNPKYVGDPINAVRIFNDKEVDELIFLDIDASAKGAQPDYELIEQIASQAFMPFCYGGGVKNIETMRRLFHIGVEKISINTAALDNQNLISEAVNIFGSQSIVVAMDIKKNIFGKYQLYSKTAQKKYKQNIIDYAKRVESLGAGELLVNSIDHDGCLNGYDINLIKQIAENVRIPVIALGGASSLQDMKAAVNEASASAVAAGSMFVFHGKHKAVLINYPAQHEIKETFKL